MAVSEEVARAIGAWAGVTRPQCIVFNQTSHAMCCAVFDVGETDTVDAPSIIFVCCTQRLRTWRVSHGPDRASLNTHGKYSASRLLLLTLSAPIIFIRLGI